MTYHEQGEHVFNNFVRTVENVKDIAVREVQALYPRATKNIFNQSYRAHIGQIENHPLIVEGRKLTSAPSGELIDVNSQLFGSAAHSFQEAMRSLVRSLIHNTGNPDSHIGRAMQAWTHMTRTGVDPSAYQRLLAARGPQDQHRISEVHRRFHSMLQHEFPLLGRDIIKSIAQDVRDFLRAQR